MEIRGLYRRRWEAFGRLWDCLELEWGWLWRGWWAFVQSWWNTLPPMQVKIHYDSICLGSYEVEFDLVSELDDGCLFGCRQKTLGKLTYCGKCKSAQGQLCGDCLYTRWYIGSSCLHLWIFSFSASWLSFIGNDIMLLDIHGNFAYLTIDGRCSFGLSSQFRIMCFRLV